MVVRVVVGVGGVFVLSRESLYHGFLFTVCAHRLLAAQAFLRIAVQLAEFAASRTEQRTEPVRHLAGSEN